MIGQWKPALAAPVAATIPIWNAHTAVPIAFGYVDMLNNKGF